MSKGSAPSAPDPYTTAQAQYQFGTQAANYSSALNDVNTVGPTGTTSYKATGLDPYSGAPIRTQTTTLSPQEQAIFNQTQGLQQSLGQTGGNVANTLAGQSTQGLPNIAPIQYGAQGAGTASGNIDSSNVPGIVSSQDAYNTGQSTALKGLMAGIDPSLQQNREQLDASLRNGGAHPGDPAYDNAMAALDADQAGARSQAAGQAVGIGNTLQNTQYGESANTNQQLYGQAQAQQAAGQSAQAQNYGQLLQNAQASNSAGSTALANYAQQIGIPLNELQSILGGNQVNAPQAQAAGTASVSAPDIQSAFNQQYQGALSGYNANVSTGNAELGAGASIAAAAAIAF